MPSEASGRSLLLKEIQEQLGLKLESAKGPVDASSSTTSSSRHPTRVGNDDVERDDRPENSSHRRRCLLGAMSELGLASQSQTSDTTAPAFDAASVKPNASGPTSMLWAYRGRRFTAQYATSGN